MTVRCPKPPLPPPPPHTHLSICLQKISYPNHNLTKWSVFSHHFLVRPLCNSSIFLKNCISISCICFAMNVCMYCPSLASLTIQRVCHRTTDMISVVSRDLIIVQPCSFCPHTSSCYLCMISAVLFVIRIQYRVLNQENILLSVWCHHHKLCILMPPLCFLLLFFCCL